MKLAEVTFLKRSKELWKFRDLIYTFVARDLKVRYRGSVLGFLCAFSEIKGLVLPIQQKGMMLGLLLIRR